MKITWYYNRLKSMRLGEVAWRLGKLHWQIKARLLHNQWALKYKNKSAVAYRLLPVFEKCHFYGLPDIKPQDVPLEWANNIIAAADKHLQQRFHYFGLGEINISENISWNHEYKKCVDLPLYFGPWMDYRDTDKLGDFKYFWELPRLQHLVTLAKAYYLTREEKYAVEIGKQIQSFNEQSPYLLGVNWIMPMEAALRLISICWIAAFMKRRLEKDNPICSEIEYIIRSHVDYIDANYAAYSSANNHLVAEAVGVYMASVCFSFLSGATARRKKSYRILCREITRQFYTDGVNKEQAVHYQILCASLFMQAALLGRANGEDFPEYYWKTLERNAEFLAAVSFDEGLYAHFGDSDDGRAVILSESDQDEIGSLLATSAVLFQRGDFKAKAKKFDEMSFWLLGKKGAEDFEKLSVPDHIPTSQKFSQGGYYILTGGKSNAKLVFDCGSLGFESIAAHGHADSLSVVLNAHGREFLVDPGTFTYVAKDPYRNYFRSTAAHNTIEVDDEDQSIMSGPFLWSHKAESILEEWHEDQTITRVVGRHNGYCRLADPVIHRRCVELNKVDGVVSIRDELEGEAEHRMSMYFHFSPPCRLIAEGANEWRVCNDGESISLHVDKNLVCAILQGSENPIGGWYSDSYDHKVPSPTLVCRGTFEKRESFISRIQLS